MSPWVATTLPSLTPTITPQPVPQKRHGALDHLIWMSGPAAMFWASAGRLMPAAAAAALAAWAFRNARRETSIVLIPAEGLVLRAGSRRGGRRARPRARPTRAKSRSGA